MIEVDQPREYTEEEINLGRAVSLLISALWNKDGTLKDFADKQGREALIRTISHLPKEIPAKLEEADRKLLNISIEEMRKTQAAIKEWFWWIVGTMVMASIVISSGIVLLLR